MARNIAIFLTTVLLFHSPAFLPAQANSWTNATSANWADPYWSLGVLPTTNQDILLTNEGWKAVAIDPNTAQDFPETMTVSSITISSPSNSYNTLLLNYAGTETPLTAQYIVLGSNSAITMLYSALDLNGPNGTMELGGVFNQTNSIVNANQIDVGSIGPAVYNMDSGVLNVSKLWVRGGFNGVFNQSGGTNNVAIAGFYAGGTYNLSGGDFNATVYFNNGEFHQTGGTIDQPLTNGGNYLLDGGVNYGGVVGGNFVQTGGTNFGGLVISDRSSCLLSNGCSFLPGLSFGDATFQQFGGTQILTNGLSLAEESIDNKSGTTTPGGTYLLHGGTLVTSNMVINYYYGQDGGTNLVAGSISIGQNFPSHVALQMDGGVLGALNLTSQDPQIILNGGRMVITNQLTVSGGGAGTFVHPATTLGVNGGQLIVSNLWIDGGIFGLVAGTVTQTGTLTLAGSILQPGPGSFQFGPLSVVASSDSLTVATIAFPSNAGCTVRFRDSSGFGWGPLVISNWSGSLYGGGSQQIIFGSNSAGLSAVQLQYEIRFQNPAGLPQGNYLARILATGEIVPDTGAPLPPQMQITGSLSNSAMPLQVQGDIGQNYAIEVSTDLINWTSWTNQSNSTGTISITDWDTTNFPQRFYRVRLIP